MYCKNCGNEIENGALFCGNCGTPVNDSKKHSTSSVKNNVNAKKAGLAIGICAAAALMIGVAVPKASANTAVTKKNVTQTTVAETTTSNNAAASDNTETQTTTTETTTTPKQTTTTPKQTTTTTTETSNETDTEYCSLYFNIDVIDWVDYDVDVYMDDVWRGTSDSHIYGKTRTTTGKHTLAFYKEGDHSVITETEIVITGDSTYSCTLTTRSGYIKLSDEEVTSGVSQNYATVPDVTGMNLKSAIQTLNKAGFNHVRSTGTDGDLIIVKSNWTVSKQSVEAGTSYDKEGTIKLTCEHTW